MENISENFYSYGEKDGKLRSEGIKKGGEVVMGALLFTFHK